MSEVRLVVRELAHDWSGTLHASSADRAIAALSADPLTLEELQTASARYAKLNPNHPFFANLSIGSSDEPYDAGVVIIDLAARLVVVDSTYSSPGPTGEVCYHDGQRATDSWLRYHLADDWKFVNNRFTWLAFAEQRRQERAARPLVNARAVFYGRPLLEFIARETSAAYARRESSGAEVGNTIQAIHAAWLLTPRDDLGGVCPRDVALERHGHLTWDLQDQAERWSLLKECPPGLIESSFAYQHGGFGTHELVQYYELVRELLWSCWDHLLESETTQPVANAPESLTLEDFFTREVPRLESIRDAWLDTPNLEFHGRTPRSIIDRERARLPEGVTGRDAMIDPDCPCCQMAADLPGPMFWHLDGSGMDDDFALDITHLTRQEWDDEQREWEQYNQRFNAECAERQRLGISDSRYSAPSEGSIWSSSFSVGDSADVPLGIRLFGIGGHLAELIVNIRSDAADISAETEVQHFIDRLNRDFGNLRELLQNSQPSLVVALIDPVINRFAESLAEVALIRPELSAKCESLTSALSKFLEPHSSESTWGTGDSEYPF